MATATATATARSDGDGDGEERMRVRRVVVGPSRRGRRRVWSRQLSWQRLMPGTAGAAGCGWLVPLG